ncbi:GNAT family N-acetyltransferase [Paraburkholderia hospita]|uniref:GNAT family N-acetyltransferase n=1 Tax=Paraburkholderia hospita TaxID=169430 RepID=UPI0008A79C1A|nr:GNAT family N-acetyltransferase [Paraburkholderia hospita]SEI14595.1 Acetyltransferase (GNAT) domain-containing protein [Paraburkholderia hospita]
MAEMSDPHIGLLSYQKALLLHEISPWPTKYEPGLMMLVDGEGADRRLTYALVEGRTVKATVVFAYAERYEGERCFSVGYAVAEKFRGSGVATDVLTRSISDLRQGLGWPVFYIEAIVDAENLASRRVCEKVLSTSPEAMTESISGKPASRYFKRVEHDV